MRGMCDISLACGLDAYAGLNAPPRFAGFYAQKACVCLFQLQRTKDITMQHPQDYGLIERLRRLGVGEVAHRAESLLRSHIENRFLHD